MHAPRRRLRDSIHIKTSKDQKPAHGKKDVLTLSMLSPSYNVTLDGASCTSRLRSHLQGTAAVFCLQAIDHVLERIPGLVDNQLLNTHFKRYAPVSSCSLPSSATADHSSGKHLEQV
eukprot:2592789-Amphidinium_carterae.1